MSAHPHDELRDLAAVAALAPLDPDEQALLDAALAADPELAALARADAATVDLLDAHVARAPLPAGLFDRILDAALAEQADGAEVPAEAPVVPIARARERRRRRLAPLGVVAVVAAAAAAVLVYVLVAPQGLGQPVAEAAIAPAPGASVTGTARLYGTDAADGRLVLDLADVPAAPAGHHYEVWVLRRGAEHMEAVGAFAPVAGSASLDLRLPGAGDYAAVDISVEEDDGPAEHSSVSVGGAAFS